MRLRPAVALAALMLSAALLSAPPLATGGRAQIVTAAPTYAEAPGKLTATEMQATFSGKYREEGTDVAGNNWSVQASANGTLSVTAGTYTDTGHARIDGLLLCVTYQKAWKGAEHCFRYAHHGRQLASYGLDGKLDSVVTVTH
jgi:hypothetical protein